MDQHTLTTTTTITGVNHLERLPNELISAIFSHIPLGGSQHTLDTSKQPWVLTTVSKRIRLIALNTAKLWSNISLYSLVNRDLFPNNARWRTYLDRLSRLVRVMVERSKGHELSVVIEADWDGFADHAFASGMKALLAERKRWGSVEIVSACSVPGSGASLNASTNAIGMNPATQSDLALSSPSSLLGTVMDGVRSSEVLHSVKLIVSGCVAADGLNTSDILSTLDHSKNTLRSLDILYAFQPTLPSSSLPHAAARPSSSQDFGPLVLPQLTHLRIDPATPTHTITFLLHHLTLPQLTRLSIACDKDCNILRPVLRSLIARSGCKVLELDWLDADPRRTLSTAAADSTGSGNGTGIGKVVDGSLLAELGNVLTLRMVMCPGMSWLFGEWDHPLSVLALPAPSPTSSSSSSTSSSSSPSSRSPAVASPEGDEEEQGKENAVLLPMLQALYVEIGGAEYCCGGGGGRGTEGISHVRQIGDMVRSRIGHRRPLPLTSKTPLPQPNTSNIALPVAISPSLDAATLLSSTPSTSLSRVWVKCASRWDRAQLEIEQRELIESGIIRFVVPHDGQSRRDADSSWTASRATVAPAAETPAETEATVHTKEDAHEWDWGSVGSM